MKYTYLITGGAGFIGTNLSERLIRDGHTVRVVDNLVAGTDPSRLPPSVEFHQVDICNTAQLTNIMEGVDYVVHLAALPRVQFSIDHPVETHEVNVGGTLSVLEAARKAKVKRIVYAASSSAYGDQAVMPLVETMPTNPKSPYGFQKFVGEGMMRTWNLVYGLETVSLRFFNVYGPHFDPEGAYALVIGKFLKQRKEGLPMTITGNGEQSRDFTHVVDTVDAIIRASQTETVGHGEVFNVGAGRNVTINEIAHLVGGPVEYIPARLEPFETRADSSAIKAALGWQPTISIEDGISDLKAWYGVA